MTNAPALADAGDADDADDALAEAKEALHMWPERAYFHYLFGRMLLKKNGPDAAIVELQWALKKEKRDAHALRNLERYVNWCRKATPNPVM